MSKDSRHYHMNRGLFLLRALHIATAPIGLIISVLLPKLGWGPIFDSSSARTVIPNWGFGCATFVCLWYVLNWLNEKKSNGKWPDTDFGWLISLSRRASLLLTTTTFGVILAYIGSGWYIWIPIFVSTEFVGIWTYPSDKRIKKWMELSKFES